MQTSTLTPTQGYLDQDVYTDLTSLSRLRHQAKVNPEQTLKSVAQQFEALFLQMVMKSMRDASFGDPLFDSDQTEFYRDMTDKQLTLTLSKGQGMGLAEALERQLRGAIRPAIADETANEMETETQPAQPTVNNPFTGKTFTLPALNIVSIHSAKNTDVSPSSEILPDKFENVEDFISTLRPLASRAADKLGVKPEVLLAQAALETGWGQHISRHADGSSSYNLFNIKAGADWQGDHVTINTLEYRGGVAQRERAAFRAYDGYEQSFNDYVDFLQSRPRYHQALKQSHDPEAYLRELQAAGYATDPHYANKILDIIQRPAIQVSHAVEGASHAG